MPRNILIGTFGGGPGIITSILDCFWELHGLSFERVILVTTDSPNMHQGYKELKDHLTQSRCPVCTDRRYINIDLCPDVVQGVIDIVTEADNNAFLSKLLAHIRRQSQSGTDIYLCLSGGRRNMTASVAFAGTLFPVAGLYDATPKKRIDGNEIKRTRQTWNTTLADDVKNALWEEANALLTRLGLQTMQQDQPPPTFGWHAHVEDFNLVRLPFIGLTPFFEALTQIIRFQHGANIENSEIKNWFDNMQNDTNFTHVMNYFSKVIGSQIDQLSPTEILSLQRLDWPFWHDCIKNETREKTPINALKRQWDKWKLIFTTQKVADELFDRFDELFASNRSAEAIRDEFESLHQQLNHKIIQTLNARSRPLVELLNNAGHQARERWKTAGGLSKYGKFSKTPIFNDYTPMLCVDGEFSTMLMEVFHNAVKFADTTYEVEVTSNHLIIRNDGVTLDREKWEKSLKSKQYPDTCLRHLLEFDLYPCPEYAGTELKISGFGLHHATVQIPINAKEIREAQDYE